MKTSIKKKASAGDSSLRERWGTKVVKCGWVGIPTLIIERQSQLKLSPSELCVLLHLIRHWWTKDKLPFPSHSAIATQMGKSTGQIQRITKALERRGFIKAHSRFNREHQGQTSNEYSFTGLVAKLEEMAEEKLAIQEDKNHQGRTRLKVARIG
jgi:hypothetical protein